MNHPVKVAERCATLDILSGGRLEVGFGKGGTQQESGTFGYDDRRAAPDDRRVHAARPALLGGGHRGAPRRVHRRPAAPGAPEAAAGSRTRALYMACTHQESLSTPAVAASARWCWASAAPTRSLRRTASTARRSPIATRRIRSVCVPNEHFAALCPAVVLDDGQRAASIGIKGQRFFMESIGHWASGGKTPLPRPGRRGRRTSPPLPATARRSFESTIGSERVTRRLLRLDASRCSTRTMPTAPSRTASAMCAGSIDAGADEILFLNQMGTIPQDAMMETIRNIGEHVIPYFRTGPGKKFIDERNARRGRGSLTPA